MAPVTVKPPGKYSSAELDAFCDLVRRGGEVAEEGLLWRVQRAKALAFAFDAGDVVGVAALKRPESDHRREVFQRAKVGVDPEEFPCELGWVFVCEEHRGKGLSRELVKTLLSNTETSIYAVSRTNNEPMQRTLGHFGFSAAGEKYRSRQHPDETLTLFIRPRASL